MHPAADALTGAGKRARNKAENRAAILEAARHVFAHLGYDAASIRDVIRQTDLASGTFYNYFPDKQAVLRALFDESMTQLHRRVREARAGARSLEQIIRLTYRECFAFLASERTAFELMRRNTDAIRTVLDEPSFLANREDLQDAIRQGLDREGLRTLDATYLTAAVNGVAFEVAACLVERDPMDVEAATTFATELILGGIHAAARAATAARKTRRNRNRPTAGDHPAR